MVCPVVIELKEGNQVSANLERVLDGEINESLGLFKLVYIGRTSLKELEIGSSLLSFDKDLVRRVQV